MSTDIASTYWKSQEEYPFPFTRRRRIYELNYLVPKLVETGGKSLLDLGCGDGSLVECLLRVTDFEEFHAYDLSPALISSIDPRVRTAVFDISSPDPLPSVDVVIIGGVIQYVFDDGLIMALLSKISAPRLFVRSTCSLTPSGERISRDGYASYYRTVPETHALLAKDFEIAGIDRVYPDELESAFGTKQFYFDARRRA